MQEQRQRRLQLQVPRGLLPEVPQAGAGGGVDERLKEMALEVADEMGFDIIEMEAMPGHVHMLLEAGPQLGIHRAVKRIKGRTSHDLRAGFPWLGARIPALWTSSHFVSTVEGAPLAVARQCIENQKSV
jgi:putative transposase